jgi:hypothetical protein
LRCTSNIARVVDHDVEPAEMLESVVDDGLAAAARRDVLAGCHRPAALAFDLRDDVLEPVGCRRAVDDDRRPAPGELERVAATEAPPGPRDDGDLTGQRDVHDP